jgi:hypothetical protein
MGVIDLVNSVRYRLIIAAFGFLMAFGTYLTTYNFAAFWYGLMGVIGAVLTFTKAREVWDLHMETPA